MTNTIRVGFPTMRWGCVATAGDRASAGSDDALAEIYREYWCPIYSFIRSRGYPADEASDLTQDYFARPLEGRLLLAADCNKGRFRTRLRADCAYFLADDRTWRGGRSAGAGSASGRSTPIPTSAIGWSPPTASTPSLFSTGPGRSTS